MATNQSPQGAARRASVDAHRQRRYEVALHLLNPDAAGPEDLPAEIRKIYGLPTFEQRFAALEQYVRARASVHPQYVERARTRLMASAKWVKAYETIAETKALGAAQPRAASLRIDVDDEDEDDDELSAEEEAMLKRFGHSREAYLKLRRADRAQAKASSKVQALVAKRKPAARGEIVVTAQHRAVAQKLFGKCQGLNLETMAAAIAERERDNGPEAA